MKSSVLKPPVLLKTLLDVIFWFTLIGLIFRLLFTVFYFFTDIPVNLTIHHYQITEFNFAFAVGIFLKLLISTLFIYAVYIMRKVVRSFFKRKLFTPLQISGLKLIGQLLIFTVLFEIILEFTLPIVFEREIKAGGAFDSSFNSVWFILAIGLFFLLLSKAFSYARSLQQENDLTV
ncbi:DUF2975 domain-containing protein [Antarcticibacterium flavum]|uniref:DUF2975 domain-containing protein n=1 Tax=Antarcticibacterium flavum TaxID=2058175 RepID=A0A5B7X4X2_9FLAO|nr:MULTISPECIES: DUF2975 domain-containing protein [Antarcticibacterium]MCM4160537.1 hypothetical protein [Antarcticibacterium sp. W02-3]QCY69801.1 DUF2975 domain-containing protein [Antarcticibacterium flavum]